jgi:hypothetical protein
MQLYSGRASELITCAAQKMADMERSGPHREAYLRKMMQ